jgi:rare lipoprotein A
MKKIKLIAPMFLSIFLVGCSTTKVYVNNNLNTQYGTPSKYKCNYTKSAKNSGAFYKTDGPLEIPSWIDDVLEPIPIYEPLHKWANKPYNRLEQEFIPLTTPGHYSQNGIGTWYGKRYHGQNTSSGEKYDMFQMTAASPVLPIPSYARVTNLRNGRSVIVRINDRGPFLKGRIIDLSFLAACRLDYALQGSTEVEVISLKP